MTFSIAAAGGVFAYLAFFHFLVDWVLQSHWEATRKHSDAWVRAGHCSVYAAGMCVAICPILGGWPLAVSAVVLWASHFVEDTYYTVYLWMRHVRRVPVVRERGVEGFREYVQTPLGLVLMIVVDQIVHLAFLWVPATFALWSMAGA